MEAKPVYPWPEVVLRSAMSMPDRFAYRRGVEHQAEGSASRDSSKRRRPSEAAVRAQQGRRANPVCVAGRRTAGHFAGQAQIPLLGVRLAGRGALGKVLTQRCILQPRLDASVGGSQGSADEPRRTVTSFWTEWHTVEDVFGITVTGSGDMLLP